MPITPEQGKNRDAIVVDLGSKSRKQIRQLRKGKGKLMDKVHECLDELKSSGTVTATAQPVVIVVKQKTRSAKFMRLFG